jgi:hypothetical protein
MQINDMVSGCENDPSGLTEPDHQVVPNNIALIIHNHTKELSIYGNMKGIEYCAVAAVEAAALIFGYEAVKASIPKPTWDRALELTSLIELPVPATKPQEPPKRPPFLDEWKSVRIDQEAAIPPP